jgi:ribose/xylose/arabinose/galactoside ABC-type transport system permease subunit
LPYRGNGHENASASSTADGNSLTLLGISPFLQGAVVGTFIVVAVAYDSVRRARGSSAG